MTADDRTVQVPVSLAQREQIAEILWVHDVVVPWAEADATERRSYLVHAEEVVAFIQNGAGR